MDARTTTERITEAAEGDDPGIEAIGVISWDGAEARTTVEIGGETFHLTVSKD